MESFAQQLSFGILAFFVPFFIITLLIICSARLVNHVFFKSRKSRQKSSNPKIAPGKHSKSQTTKKSPKLSSHEYIAAQIRWRRLESLSSAEPIFAVGDTGIFSPYQTDLTAAELDLAECLLSYFKDSQILVDNYFNLSGSSSKSNAPYLSTSTKPAKPHAPGTVQIDCIAVDERGIFVFESKDYAGWIFGNGKHSKWTQVLAYGEEKFRFYNPVKQNLTHINALRKIVGSTVNIYSVIVFSDRAVLRDITVIPQHTYVCNLRRLDDALERIQPADVLQPVEIISICQKLRQHRLKVTPAIRQQHAVRIKDHLGTDRVYS